MKKSLYETIWHIVTLIPEGYVATYGQIAKLLNPPCSPRQVGYALFHHGRLAPHLIIPWHRVINSQGKIAMPPTDWRFEKQKHLLQQEDIPLLNGKIDLKYYQWQPDAAAIQSIHQEKHKDSDSEDDFFN